MATPGTSITSHLDVGARMAPAVATYAPRDPRGTVLYHVIAEHLETFLGSENDSCQISVETSMLLVSI